mmetsp:Transcript_26452/g.73038  ORF Transcript_26452/g.73038 Transcript_26452/m.73038 type:complete len:215 (-) Transcript_26452:27-671(-)
MKIAATAISFLLSLLLLPSIGHGFLLVENQLCPPTRQYSHLEACTTGGSKDEAPTTTRDEFLAQVAAMTTVAVSPARPARADITSKLASSAALRNAKSVQKKLSTLELYVVQQDYVSIKESLRVAPVSDIRKSCTTLVRGGDDGPDAQQLEGRYNTFMSSLERLDSLASVGMRGRKVSSGDFYAAYKSTVDGLVSFLEVAQEAADIPVQYATDE